MSAQPAAVAERRRLLAAAFGACLVAAAGFPAPAFAAWTGAGVGPASTSAYRVPTPTSPVATVEAANVVVSWEPIGGPAGAPATVYVVRRYEGVGTPATILADCDASTAELTCTETAVPDGVWRYTITASQAGWIGPESPLSPPVDTGP